MTHYIRWNGKTLVDAESEKDDLHVTVCIEEYTKFLLDFQTPNGDNYTSEIATDFGNLQELRGEYFEAIGGQETPKELVERRLKQVCEKYWLAYVID